MRASGLLPVSHCVSKQFAQTQFTNETANKQTRTSHLVTRNQRQQAVRVGSSKQGFNAPHLQTHCQISRATQTQSQRLSRSSQTKRRRNLQRVLQVNKGKHKLERRLQVNSCRQLGMQQPKHCRRARHVVPNLMLCWYTKPIK